MSGLSQEGKEFGLEGLEEVKTRIQQYLVELHVIHKSVIHEHQARGFRYRYLAIRILVFLFNSDPDQIVGYTKNSKLIPTVLANTVSVSNRVHLSP